MGGIQKERRIQNQITMTKSYNISLIFFVGPQRGERVAQKVLMAKREMKSCDQRRIKKKGANLPPFFDSVQMLLNNFPAAIWHTTGAAKGLLALPTNINGLLEFTAILA
jgi:hypothetical protein